MCPSCLRGKRCGVLRPRPSGGRIHQAGAPRVANRGIDGMIRGPVGPKWQARPSTILSGAAGARTFTTTEAAQTHVIETPLRPAVRVATRIWSREMQTH